MKKISKKERMEVENLDFRREARLAAIQELIPIGLKAVHEELQAEVAELAGPRYSRGGDLDRWGMNQGSVFLGDQKVRVRVPRVRRKSTNEEIPLYAYERLQAPGLIEETALKRVIHGISTGNYAKAARCVPETLGIKRDSISRKWIRCSSKELKTLQERSLEDHEIVALVIDGKTFGENEIIVGLGITVNGEKVLLGMIEANTENYTVCRDFLNSLLNRGIKIFEGLLVVIDGGKGLRKAVDVVLGKKGFVQRCQFHKRQNVMGYLTKAQQGEYGRKIQSAYEIADYEKAKKRLMLIRGELKEINQSAANSLDEGLEETLTLHRLGVFKELGTSLKTTNLIENINGLLEKKTGRVCRWRNSAQRQRWVATALIQIEPGLRRLRGYEHLPALKAAMKEKLQVQESNEIKKAA